MLTSPNIVASLPLQRTQLFIAFISPGSTSPLDRGGILGDLTDFSYTKWHLVCSKGLKRAMNHTLTSPNIVASITFQKTQFFIAFISPGSTPPLDRGGILGDLTDFSSKKGLLVCSKGLRRAMNRTLTSPDIVVGLALQRTQFFIAFSSPGSTHAGGSS